MVGLAGKPRQIAHGTIGGYVTHRRRPEDACPACKQAWDQYYSARRHGIIDPLLASRLPAKALAIREKGAKK